jgi:hypothetical protein
LKNYIHNTTVFKERNTFHQKQKKREEGEEHMENRVQTKSQRPEVAVRGYE